MDIVENERVWEAPRDVLEAVVRRRRLVAEGDVEASTVRDQHRRGRVELQHFSGGAEVAESDADAIFFWVYKF